MTPRAPSENKGLKNELKTPLLTPKRQGGMGPVTLSTRKPGLYQRPIKAGLSVASPFPSESNPITRNATPLESSVDQSARSMALTQMHARYLRSVPASPSPLSSNTPRKALGLLQPTIEKPLIEQSDSFEQLEQLAVQKSPFYIAKQDTERPQIIEKSSYVESICGKLEKAEPEMQVDKPVKKSKKRFVLDDDVIFYKVGLQDR